MTKPAPQPREFQSAAMVTDLPNELMSALSQGLSQFGINLPAVPSSLTGADAGMPTTLTAPGSLASPGLTSPALTPGLTTPPAAGLPGATTPATDRSGAVQHRIARSGSRTTGRGQSGADQSGTRPPVARLGFPAWRATRQAR